MHFLLNFRQHLEERKSPDYEVGVCFYIWLFSMLQLYLDKPWYTHKTDWSFVWRLHIEAKILAWRCTSSYINANHQLLEQKFTLKSQDFRPSRAKVKSQKIKHVILKLSKILYWSWFSDLHHKTKLSVVVFLYPLTASWLQLSHFYFLLPTMPFLLELYTCWGEKVIFWLSCIHTHLGNVSLDP